MNDYHARQLPQPTVRRYLNLLETSYLLVVPSTARLHAGEKLEWLAPDVLAAPWWRVL